MRDLRLEFCLFAFSIGIWRVDHRLLKPEPQASTSLTQGSPLAGICVCRFGKQLLGYKLSFVSVLSSVEGGESPEYMKS